jgi:hypothetical protein
LFSEENCFHLLIFFPFFDSFLRSLLCPDHQKRSSWFFSLSIFEETSKKLIKEKLRDD